MPESAGRRVRRRIARGLQVAVGLVVLLGLAQALFGTAGAGTSVEEYSLSILVIDAASGRPVDQADVLVIEGGAREARAFVPVPPAPAGPQEEMDQVVNGLAARGRTDAAGVCTLGYLQLYCSSVSGWDLLTKREPDPAPPVRGTCLVAATGYVTEIVELSRFVADRRDRPSAPGLGTPSRLRTTVALHRRSW